MTLSDVKREVLNLARQYPNARYIKEDEWKRCYYDRGKVENGPKTEGCIIGQALIRLKINFKDMNRWASNFLDSLNINGAGDICDFLDEVQEKQDEGKTWSEAIIAAGGKL